jgi:hypothetical protein
MALTLHDTITDLPLGELPDSIVEVPTSTAPQARPEHYGWPLPTMPWWAHQPPTRLWGQTMIGVHPQTRVNDSGSIRGGRTKLEEASAAQSRI